MMQLMTHLSLKPTDKLSAAIISLIVTFFTAQTAYSAPEDSDAQVRYVVDQIYISVREKPLDNANRVARGIGSGSKLILIKEDPASGYSLVETEDGKQGWAQSRYLQDTPTNAMQVEKLQEKIQLLSKSSDQSLLKQISSLEKENKKLSVEHSKLDKELKELKHASANVIKINEQNHELIKKNQLLQSQVDSLEAVKDQFEESENITFFIYGGLLVLATIILMNIYDGIKRRRSYGSDGW